MSSKHERPVKAETIDQRLERREATGRNAHGH